MVTTEQIIPRILDACPSFAEPWKRHLEWWLPDLPGNYNNTSAVAEHVVALLRKGATSEFPRLFDAVERLLEEGTEDVRGVVSVGLLESIQNIASHEPPGYVAFEEWLQSRTLTAWREIERMWEGTSSLADMVRRERGE